MHRKVLLICFMTYYDYAIEELKRRNPNKNAQTNASKIANSTHMGKSR